MMYICGNTKYVQINMFEHKIQYVETYVRITYVYTQNMFKYMFKQDDKMYSNTYSNIEYVKTYVRTQNT